MGNIVQKGASGWRSDILVCNLGPYILGYMVRNMNLLNYVRSHGSPVFFQPFT
jgi:3-deoxy-D-manno-octulosonic acid (KDO) 8-phosphate synthase